MRAGVATIILLACSPLAFAELKAGAAQRTITPDLEKHGPVYMAGFGHNRRATGIHDDLFARCLAIQPGETPVLICGVDSIGLFWDDVQKIRAIVKQKVGRVDVVIAALHDHEAPDTMGLWGPTSTESGINEDYVRFLVNRTAEAGIEAVERLRPATLKLAKAHPVELDTLIKDNRPPDVHDSEVVMLSAFSTDGKPIGTLLNWANHPETLGSKNTEITADFPGYLRPRLEELLGGTAVFVNGAVGGMQSPLNAKIENTPDNSFEKARHIGRRVAEIAAEAVQTAKPVNVTRYEFSERILKIPVQNKGFDQAAKADLYHGRKLTIDGKSPSPVGLIRLLNRNAPVLEIALLPGELYPELSVGGVARYEGADFPDAPIEPAIKNMMTAPYRMLFGLADDEIGYIIPKAEWDDQAPWLQNAPKRWYGEVNSIGPEAAGMITDTLRELLALHR